jgi:glycosyltransferase involved in cell wall biosynthesis
VNSEYTRQSFLEAGVAERKLRRRRLDVDSRFVSPAGKPRMRGLRIVYVGGLTVAKGVPVLIDAFSRLADPNAQLTLVGGSGSRGMSRYLKAALLADGRIFVAPGDPLPHLQAADVCVHPSWSDGFGYGPAEALACGVPVIVTEDTGMKELVREGENGWVVPTGSVQAIVERLERFALAHPLPRTNVSVKRAEGPA